MKFLALLTLLGLITNTYAQVPQGIPYQAIARNGQGQPLANTNVKVRFSILDSTATGTAVYIESHNTTTSALGLFTANVGMGNASTGTFSAINWGQNYKFLKVELDTTATGNSYIDLGTQQMMSVPYALYAGKLSLDVLTSSFANKFSIEILNKSARYNLTSIIPAYGAALVSTDVFSYPNLYYHMGSQNFSQFIAPSKLRLKKIVIAGTTNGTSSFILTSSELIRFEVRKSSSNNYCNLVTCDPGIVLAQNIDFYTGLSSSRESQVVYNANGSLIINEGERVGLFLKQLTANNGLNISTMGAYVDFSTIILEFENI
jgi:hypothetical protein